MNYLGNLFIVVSLLAAAFFWNYGTGTAFDAHRPPRFLLEERQIIERYYQKGKRPKHKGLPPGLAKRGGSLPPGLQRQLDRNGRLPPGLQKRLDPLPTDLERRLPPLAEHWERVILERHIVLIDRRTQRILDIIENVIALSQGR